MPIELQEARARRIKRAFDLDMKKQILPESEWVTDEQDVPYLESYVQLVEQEDRERREYKF